MSFCLNISIQLFDMNSSDDYFKLAELFDDCTLSEFIEDNMYAKYIYFIKENNDIIGFIYLMQYKNHNVYNIEYGLKHNKLNKDYIYTILTLMRDKIKGIDDTTEIKDLVILSSVFKNSQYDSIASLYGEKLYSNDLYNFYNVNPNCEDLSKEKQKINVFLKSVANN